MKDDANPATKGDLRKLSDVLREEMASKDDLKKLGEKLREEMASKDDLKKLSNVLREEMASKDDLKKLGEKLRDEFHGDMGVLKDEILRHFDLTVETIRHDLDGANRDEISVLNDKTQNHEKRIRRLETTAGIAA